MTLSATDQRFLAVGYGWGGAGAALADDGSAKGLASSLSGGASRYAYYDTDTKGIHYTLQGEKRTGIGYGNASHAHHITWAQIKAHRESQPAPIRLELIEAREAYRAEEYRHYEAGQAISPNGYSTKVRETVKALDAERDRHYSAWRPLLERSKAAALAMLPDASDEPADLIEWAAVTA